MLPLNLVRAEDREGMSKRMTKRMSERISFFQLTNKRWVREKFSTNEELHNLMKMTDINRDRDIPRDINPFSVFGSDYDATTEWH